MNEAAERTESVFAAVLAIGTAKERADFLNQACSGDHDLRARIDALLRAHGRDGHLLDRPIAGLHGPAGEVPGAVVAGRYKLLEQIGEGGMGTVWMAKQTEPVKRLVALKLIKTGMDSKQVLARFEAERQALALMDHPNIAKVLDAGQSPPDATGGLGRPYFVMELVKGVCITKYCDENRLTPRQRLELFVPVCEAIQHAHQKGIIHRDLKPSNIVVTLYDEHAVPKVIDFGVAKATGPQLTEETLHTGFGAIVGTVEYMSPEQASFNQLDVDTRSDVYSLGVLLYELLAGSPPISRKETEAVGLLETLRVIREQEPPKPSSRLSTADGLPGVAANRGVEPKQLTALVRGELDWIVMKCLEKDRDRRYQTSNGLALDLKRYLADEPVQACPPTKRYRLGKFTRRNKAAIAIGACLSVLVATLAGGIGWTMHDRSMRQSAVDYQVQLELQETERRQAQERYSEALSAVIQADRLLTTANPDGRLLDRVRRLRADLEMVIRVETIQSELTSLPGNSTKFDFAKRESEYTDAFRDYGIDVDALDVASAAEAIRGSSVGLQLAVALDAWAEARRYARTANTSRAHLLAVARAADPDPWRVRVRDALESMDGGALLAVAREVPISEASPITLGLLGRALGDRRAGNQKEELLRQARARHPNSFWLNYDLAMACFNQQPTRLDEVIRYLSAAQAIRPDNPAVYIWLTSALRGSGAIDEAISVAEEAVRRNVPDGYVSLGDAYGGKKRWPEAISAYRQGILRNPDSYLAAIGLGNALTSAGRFDEGIAEYERAARLRPNDALPHSNLGNVLRLAGKLDEAIMACSEAIRLKLDFAQAHYFRGLALHQRGNLREAIDDFRNASRFEPGTARYHNAVAWELATSADLGLRNPAEAVDRAYKATQLAPSDGKYWNTLGAAQYRMGDWNATIAAFEKSMALHEEGNSGNWFFFAMAHWNLGHQNEARKWFDQAVLWMNKYQPKNDELHRFRKEAGDLLRR